MTKAEMTDFDIGSRMTIMLEGGHTVTGTLIFMDARLLEVRTAEGNAAQAYVSSVVGVVIYPTVKK